ncbi:AbrB family transcriptional regulator [Halomonas sp. YLGW01]|uniref:AbrB family transcriptional regulator n=1 Tax=Halomonas sp. YLGW01 TaxID=2773308 RepID=UPI001780EF87|nr:AbrB family transcriptional regulator [Halomonas sp. YLGW01]
MNDTLTTRLTALGRFLPTLALGLAGGALAFWLQLPLPWLLGAMIATTLASLGGVRLRSPGRGRKGVLVVIGVMLGSAFHPGLKIDVVAWGASIAIMLLATAVMMAFSVWFSRRVAGHSLETALYAGVPGGVSTVTVMALKSGADLRVVGMTHAVRILILLLAIPLALPLLGHVDLPPSSTDLSHWLWLPAPVDAAWLAAAGLAGAWLGKRLRLPNALLFGPALASTALHLTGLTEAALPPSLIALAQVIIGVSVGVRFSGTSLARVGHLLVMGTLQALALLLIAGLAAWVAFRLTDTSMAAALLAYMPGGAPELSLVALSLGIDPAFVTAHHLLRITLLILCLPLLLRVGRRLGA